MMEAGMVRRLKDYRGNERRREDTHMKSAKSKFAIMLSYGLQTLKGH